ncbi:MULTISPECIES: response regulator [Lacrimispora]|jgi:two-component system response regulator YesN|uniref:response regulator transcription factor n=1 Tax=Lacrimispora TaxID=2719231 RepID=UPI000BE41FF7|nr:response regulator [Lacrimispora amygdalina]MDK2965272.1 two-component system, response regulator YesN [Lacrimispora sp.]
MVAILGMVIADDEKKICKLIEYLVNWDEIGIQLLGTAYDGITALQLINEKKPDILLTDIRMPGMDGLCLIEEAKKQNEILKCIIISGYKDFQYAQQGMRFGVRDYLLKPINQEDLTRTLKKLVKETHEQISKQSTHLHLEETLKTYTGTFQHLFFKTVLQKNLCEQEETILQELREISAADIIKNSSRCIAVKPNISYREFTKESYQLLTEKTLEIAEVEFSSHNWIWISEITREGIYFLLFYDTLDRKELLESINHIKERVLSLQDLFPRLYFHAVISEPADSCLQLIHRIKESRIAIGNRFLTSLNTVSEIKSPDTLPAEPESIDTMISSLLEGRPEAFDMAGIKKCVEAARDIMTAEDVSSCLQVKKNLLVLLNYYLKGFRQLDTTLADSEIEAWFSEMYEHCTCIEQTFCLLEETLCKTLQNVLEHLKNREIKPVIYAKHYIEENKGINIKLEELAKNTGFSYTYFSSLFKKETGKTLTEYIQMVRIESAKKLLTEKERSISEVAELAGYNDIKFFTRQFKKTLGVSPNEYRKLFTNRSQGGH